jgi:deazaflavin-dependent oxidoreductase (nitroreductase family)
MDRTTDTAARRTVSALYRHRLRRLNRWLVVPLFRMGLGGVFGDPLGGWLMVLRTRGRRSGRVREVGLDYVIHRGSIYCLAGFGPTTAWLLNLQADPVVDVLLPGRAVRGHAEVVLDPDERSRVIPKVVRAAGFAALSVDRDPWHVDDARLVAEVGDLPLVRIRVRGLAAGPADPGGSFWIVKFAASLALAALLLGRAASRR